ncbi:ESCO1/2 acetyl-transferase-domain-containing protein [Neocallimastix lanati (nom. inval.)]|nr:ESCO1/2 acetyl-transferase-domain-containing protein [Neocallimastix sp. JGI-2020a]
MTINNIKFTYKRKDNNTFQSLNNKKIRLLNSTGNEIIKENEISFENVDTYKLKNKKQNHNDISSYFNKKIPKHDKEPIESSDSPMSIMKSKRTIESYFQSKPNKGNENKIKNSEKNIDNKKNDSSIIDKKKMQTKKNYEQLYIDFGQKGISPIICTECGMPYNPSIQEDDLQHQQYHNIIIDGIEYNGYKTDNVVQKFSKNVYISEVEMSETTSSHKNKLLQILNLIETELGAVKLNESLIQHYKFFLYIKNKKLIGCAIVRDVKEGYRIEIDDNIEQITTLESIDKSKVSRVSTLCGISRIWVSRKERKKGIASQLLESIRYLIIKLITLF